MSVGGCAKVAGGAVGVRTPLELAAERIRAGGTRAKIGGEGRPATLDLETLWLRNVTITTGLVDSRTIPQLLSLISGGRLNPTVLTTHRFPITESMAAYDVFADAANSKALKVVLEGTPVATGRTLQVAAAVS